MNYFIRGFVIAIKDDLGMFVDFAREYEVEGDHITRLVIGSSGGQSMMEGKIAHQTKPEFMLLEGTESEHMELRPVRDRQEDGALYLKALKGTVFVEGYGPINPGMEITILPDTDFSVGPWKMRYQLDAPEGA